MTSGIECALTGFLPRDPDELRSSKTGLPWLSFSVGVGEGDGKQWVGVVVFGELAEAIAPRLYKGGKVYIEGRLSLDKWRGKDGQQQHRLKVAAFRVEMLNQIGRNRPRKAKGSVADTVHGGDKSNATMRSDLNDEVPF